MLYFIEIEPCIATLNLRNCMQKSAFTFNREGEPFHGQQLQPKLLFVRCNNRNGSTFLNISDLSPCQMARTIICEEDSQAPQFWINNNTQSSGEHLVRSQNLVLLRVRYVASLWSGDANFSAANVFSATNIFSVGNSNGRGHFRPSNPMHQPIILTTKAESHQLHRSHHVSDKDELPTITRRLVRILMAADDFFKLSTCTMRNMTRKATATSTSSIAQDSQTHSDVSQMVQYLALSIFILILASQQLIFLRRLSTRFKERERIMSVSEGDCTKSHSLIPYESLSKLQKLLHNIRKSLNSKHSKLANQCLIARECEHPWIHAWILAGYTGCRTILALILNFGMKFSFPWAPPELTSSQT